MKVWRYELGDNWKTGYFTAQTFNQAVKKARRISDREYREEKAEGATRDITRVSSLEEHSTLTL